MVNIGRLALGKSDISHGSARRRTRHTDLAGPIPHALFTYKCLPALIYALWLFVADGIKGGMYAHMVR